MQHIKTIALIGALAVTARVALAETAGSATNAPATNAPAVSADKLFADPVIVKGKGLEIKRSELDDAFTQAVARAAAQGQQIPESVRPMLEARMLREIIVSKLLTAQATDADKAKAKETAAKFIADVRKQLGSEEAFQERLKMNKLTSADELQQKVAEEALPKEVLQRYVESKVAITPEQINEFYTNNPSKFEVPEEVHAAHILIGTKTPDGKDMSDADKAEKHKLIESILKRAKAGEDFAALAKEFSEDPGSKNNGGEYTFPRGQMVPEFEAAAFALDKGQISDVVTTSYGYHIIKQIEKKPAHTVPLADASDDIKAYLTSQQASKFLPEYFQQLQKDADVQILDPDLKAADEAAQAQAAKAKAAPPMMPGM